MTVEFDSGLCEDHILGRELTDGQHQVALLDVEGVVGEVHVAGRGHSGPLRQPKGVVRTLV